ncbi:lectin [Streptomyces sp. NPDC020667]|uniref:GH92 family glycosyl hydrolase n=1 Tax=Streptomyces sp. NPDC020667 TaxID=3154895 RepID=UPI0033F4F3C6
MAKAMVSGLLLMPSQALGTDAAATAPEPVEDPASLVNPLIGTAGTVNTFPGPDMPFGMLQWGPDTFPHRAFGGGYEYRDSKISGFSLTHLSGPGCRAAGDVPILPVTGKLPGSPGDAVSGFSHAHEHTGIGYYGVTDDAGITTELTSAVRAGLGRFTFPRGTDSRLLLKLSGGATPVDGTRVRAVGDHEVVGAVDSGHFCGAKNRYTLHFDIRFDRPFTDTGTWTGDAVHPAPRTLAEDGRAPSAPPAPGTGGMYLTFDTRAARTVTAEVGISYTSDANAARNLEHEVGGRGFDGIRQDGHDAWNRVLGRVRVGGGSRDQQVQFYTALYHSLLHPNVFSDVNGQYAGMDGRTHTLGAGQRAQYANFSGWDTYRSQAQLMAIVTPRTASDAVTSMLNGYDQTGLLPKWAQNNSESHVMAGDPAAAIIAGTHAFGARGFDTAHALEALVREATEPNANRPGEAVRDAKGYLPADHTAWGCCNFYGPVSTQLEYDTADYALAALARSLGRAGTYRRFATRAQDWRNVFNPQTGYLQARLADGRFAPRFKPATAYGFIEGTSAQYTPMVPFDLKALIAARGGTKAYGSYLDSLFTDLRRPSGTNADLGNEPSLGTPWQYDYLAQPWKTQALIRRIQRTLYSDSPAGAFGNDDLGAMSSWYVFSALGMYPGTPGTDTLVLGSPLFPRAELTLAEGRTLRVNAPQARPDAPYVSALEVDGQAWQKSWVGFESLRHGGSLDYTLDSRPHTDWASAPDSVPPSDTTGLREVHATADHRRARHFLRTNHRSR